jgi:hypothetical protein
MSESEVTKKVVRKRGRKPKKLIETLGGLPKKTNVTAPKIIAQQILEDRFVYRHLEDGRIFKYNFLNPQFGWVEVELPELLIDG